MDVLEIGSASGFLLSAVKPLVASVTEMEPGPYRHWATETHGIPASSDLSEAEEAGLRFDVILLYFVVERLRDPIAQLGRLRKLLNPGGMVAIEVPNVEDALVQLYALDEFDRFYGQKLASCTRIRRSRPCCGEPASIRSDDSRSSGTTSRTTCTGWRGTSPEARASTRTSRRTCQCRVCPQPKRTLALRHGFRRRVPRWEAVEFRLAVREPCAVERTHPARMCCLGSPVRIAPRHDHLQPMDLGEATGHRRGDVERGGPDKDFHQPLPSQTRSPSPRTND